MLFYLGTHLPHWLRRTDVPLFISRRPLARRKPPVARGPWVLDSGGFTELSLHGQWQVSPVEYTMEVQRLSTAIGKMEWAAPQDWMCEPWIVAKTGLSVREHQQRTVANILLLRQLAPEIPFAPVLQGWTPEDYMTHVAMYRDAGLKLADEKIVGVGSVCRRQHTTEAGRIFGQLHDLGLRLHGFGVKVSGLKTYGSFLTSADSMAWSRNARWQPPLPQCVGHKNCANCFEYAMQWREKVVGGIA